MTQYVVLIYYYHSKIAYVIILYISIMKYLGQHHVYTVSLWQML